MPNENLNEANVDMIALQTKMLDESKLNIDTNKLYSNEPIKNIIDESKEEAIIDKIKRIDDCFKDLSIVTIFRDEDAHFLSTYLKSIPNGCEVILARTVKKNIREPQYLNFDEPKLINSFIINNSTIKVYDIFYFNKNDNSNENDYFSNRFSFADMLNQAINLASNKIIIRLDIDEQLTLTNRDMRLFLDNPKSAFVAYLTDNELLNAEPFFVKIIRIWHNNKNLKYVNRCHESIQPSLKENGFNIYQSPVIIRHSGYNTEENLSLKYQRNIGLMAADLVESFKYKQYINWYIVYMLHNSILSVLKKDNSIEFQEFMKNKINNVHYNYKDMHTKINALNELWKCGINIDINFIYNALINLLSLIAIEGYVEKDRPNTKLLIDIFEILSVLNDIISVPDYAKSQNFLL